jgi:aromatic ring-cleaving dioxygenase
MIVMSEVKDPTAITGYHAHIYYDDASRERAARIRELIESNFKVVMGRWRDMPVGPHPQAMYQVAFSTNEFPRLVPWLMLNRDGLVVLVHPETGDAYNDHAVNPLWLGEKLQLNVEMLKNLSKT